MAQPPQPDNFSPSPSLKALNARAQAQACFDYCYPTHGTPKDSLGDDNDLIACESLP